MIVESKAAINRITLEDIESIEKTREISPEYKIFLEKLGKSSKNAIFKKEPSLCLRLIKILDQIAEKDPEIDEINRKIVAHCRKRHVFLHAKGADDFILHTKKKGKVRMNFVAFKTLNEWCKNK